MISRPAEHPGKTHRMKLLRQVRGFVPFVLFAVLTLPLGVKGAAWLGVVAAAIIVVTTARDGIQIPPAAQCLILLVIAVLSVTGGHAVDAVLTKYGVGFAGVVLGLYLVATAASVPFTAQVSRASVPPEVSRTPQFLEINRRISTAWGTATLVNGLGHLAAAEIGTHGGELVLRLAVAWVIPIAACWLAAGYTQRVVAEARQLQARAHQLDQERAA